MNSILLRVSCIAVAGVLWLGMQPQARAQDANRDAAVTLTQARDLVDRVAKRSGEFREEFEKAMNHSMENGTKFEDRAKRRAQDLNEAAKKLKDVFGDKKDKNDPAIREQVDKTLSAGGDVGRVLATSRFTDKLQHDWEVLRADLNALAQIYSLSQI
jgi:hypothetical protein